MAKKKSKKRNPGAGPPQPLVRLSQCMIVKNEEENIEKALGWAKGIAFEQIVVDTGSVDRTVEKAESLGAKVYHFEWINDFSAAKNYAIEQAKGNWIAFLDADEYLIPEDAKWLLHILKQMQSDHGKYGKWKALNFPWAHLDENGEPFAIQDQERIFRSSCRYVGRIHERLDATAENIAHIDEVTIYHTGYAKGALDKTKKAERNIELLRVELSEKPNDLNAKVFLADSLISLNDAASIAEAESLFLEALADNADVMSALKRKAYVRLISNFAITPRKPMSKESLCRKALLSFPGDLDIGYFLGMELNANGRYAEAREVLKKCEYKMSDKDALTNSEIISANPSLLQAQISIAEQGGIG